MKIVGLLLLTLACGCVGTYVKTPSAYGVRLAVLYPFEAGTVELSVSPSTNTVFSMSDYKTDGGAVLVERAVGAAVKAAKE